MFKESCVATLYYRRDEWDICFDPMKPFTKFMPILRLIQVFFGFQVLQDLDL